MKYPCRPEACADGPEAPWSFDSEEQMFKWLKPVASMPIEMKRAWETAHPKDRSIDRMVITFRLFVIIVIGLFVDAFGGFFIVISAMGLLSVDTGLDVLIRVLCVVPLIMLCAVAIGLAEKGLTAIDKALKNERLGLLGYLERGCDLPTIRDCVQTRLHQVAIDMTAKQKQVALDRVDSSVSDLQLRENIDAMLQLKSSFNQTLALAVEFGLSDGNRRQYFAAAGRKIPAPS